MRIDVNFGEDSLERELANLYARLSGPDGRLRDTPALHSGLPGLKLRCREAYGEIYVYVEDIARQRLGGYVVFNRLPELTRRADALLRSPHARFAQEYQRRGLASGIYRWALEAGLCLVSGARQSAGADGLWRALMRHHAHGYVTLRHRVLDYLGSTVDISALDALSTRRLLLGSGWTLPAFARAVDMSLPPAGGTTLGPGHDVSAVRPFL